MNYPQPPAGNPDDERTVRFDGAGYPGAAPGWASPPPPQPPPIAKRLALGVIALSVVISLGAIVILVGNLMSDDPQPTGLSAAPTTLPSGYTPPSRDAPLPPEEPNLVKSNQLAEILGTQDELTGFLQVVGLRPTVDFFFLLKWTSAREECGGVLFPALPQGYHDANYESTRTQQFVDFDNAHPDYQKPTELIVIQQATAFESSAAANEFVDSQSANWAKCADKMVTLHKEDWDERYLVAASTFNDGMLAVTTVRDGDEPWSCHHALTSRRNVAVDVAICSKTGSTQAAEWAQRLADRVPGQ